MGLIIRAVYAWYSPDADTYGSAGGAVSDGAGMLELDNTAAAAMVVEVLIGAPAIAKVIKGAFVKDFSQTVKNNEASGETRLIYKNQVQAFIGGPIIRIFLQLYTVVDTVNSTYKLRLNDDDTEAANDSASSFSYGHGNQYDLLIATDGNDWVLYVDGVEEIRFAGTRKMGAIGGASLAVLGAAGSDDSGNSSTRFGGYAYVEFDGPLDLPDVANTVFAELTLVGESATYQDYVGGVGATHPDKDNVNDWESGSADDAGSSDHMNTESGVTKLQAYITPTYTVVNDHIAVVIQHKSKARTGSKFGAGNAFVFDGSNITHAASNIPLASWIALRRIFPFAPRVTMLNTTFIAFVDGGGGDDSITDSGNGLGIFSDAVGEVIEVWNSASNDGNYTILTVSAGTITVASGSLVTEGAGNSIDLIATPTWKAFSSWPGLELGHRTITDPDEDVEAIELTAIQGEILDLAVVAGVVGNPGDPQNFRRQVIL